MLAYKKSLSYQESSGETLAKIDELRRLCKPVVEYLRAKHTPYEKIIIDSVSVELLSGELGANYEIPD